MSQAWCAGCRPRTPSSPYGWDCGRTACCCSTPTRSWSTRNGQRSSRPLRRSESGSPETTITASSRNRSKTTMYNTAGRNDPSLGAPRGLSLFFTACWRLTVGLTEYLGCSLECPVDHGPLRMRKTTSGVVSSSTRNFPDEVV